MKKNQVFCLWRNRVHAFHPFLQKPSRLPPGLGNIRWDWVHGHECLFTRIQGDLPPSSGIKCCILTSSENREAIHFVASFANLVTKLQRFLGLQKWQLHPSYSVWLSSWKDTISQMAKQEMERSKIKKGKGRQQCFATLTVHQFDGADGEQCLLVKTKGPKPPSPWCKLSEHWSDVTHSTLASTESRPQLI